MSYYVRFPSHEQETSTARIWQGCLPESPTCTHPGCQSPARTVDPFFPYLDDRNRCVEHGPVPTFVALPRRGRGPSREFFGQADN
jgi:hypothetical protein